MRADRITSIAARLHAARRIALKPCAPKYRGDTDYTIRKKMRGFIIVTDQDARSPMRASHMHCSNARAPRAGSVTAPKPHFLHASLAPPGA